MKKTIGIFINTLQIGGAEKQAIMLAKALKDYYTVYLIIFYGDLCDYRYLDIIKEEKIELIRLNGNLLKKLLRFYHILQSKRIEYLFTYLATANVVGGLIGKLYVVKYIIAGIRNSQLSPFKRNIQRFLHNWVFDYSIFNNYSGAISLSAHGFRKSKIQIIPNCFELNISPRLRKERKITTILSVGRFVEQKDYLTAIKAITNLKKMINGQYEFCYVIVGYGYLEKEIRSYINKYGLKKDVHIHINPDNINEFYKKADIFLNTSLFEGVSNSIMEAMSFSLPIIATNAGDTDKLIKDGANGYLTKIKDDKTLAEKLYSLSNSASLRNEFGISSYNHLRDHFSFDSFQSSYLSLIKEISK